MSQDLGGFVGHRPRAARTKFLQLLSAQEENVLLGKEVSTSKGRYGAQCPHLLTLTGPDQLVEEQLQHSLTVEQAAPVQGGTYGRDRGQPQQVPSSLDRCTQVGSSLFDEVLRLLTAQEDTWPLCHSPH